MRIAFRAIDGGWLSDEDTMGFSFGGIDEAGCEHYLNLQRSPKDDDDDWGIHLEFDDQIWGDYGSVKQCRLTRDMLSVDICGPLSEHLGEVDGFDVRLSRISNESYDELRRELPRAFRGFEDQLVLA